MNLGKRNFSALNVSAQLILYSLDGKIFKYSNFLTFFGEDFTIIISRIYSRKTLERILHVS